MLPTKKNLALYQGLVYKLAYRQHRTTFVPVEDLAQGGTLGLLKAFERYDPSVGAFTTFAYPYIHGEIRKTAELFEKTIRVPHNIIDGITKAHSFSKAYREQHSRDPTEQETATSVGWTVEKLNLNRSSYTHALTGSLDRYIEDCGSSLAEVIPCQKETPWSYVLRLEQDTAVRDAIDTLPPRQRAVTILRFGIDERPHSQTEIAERLGISKPTVKRDINKALKTLRQAIDM